MVSPCDKTCRLHDDTCTGCQRSREEITRWTRMSDPERAAVLALVETRRNGHVGRTDKPVGTGDPGRLDRADDLVIDAG